MRLTRAGEYAIRCVLFLAINRERSVVGRKEVSEAMDIPHQFLGKIAQDLARSGILSISQGAQGGYSLCSPPEKITLLDVVEGVEGEIFLNDCVGRPESCNRNATCSVHGVWTRARERLRDVLSNVTFAELAAEEQSSVLARAGDGEKNRQGMTVE